MLGQNFTSKKARQLWVPRDTGYKQPCSSALQFLYCQQLHYKKKQEKFLKKEKEIFLLLPLALMCEASLKLSVKEMLWMCKLFWKYADKLSTAVLMLLPWTITSANSFSKSNCRDTGNRTENFRCETSSETETWEQGRGGKHQKLQLPLKCVTYSSILSF